VSTFSQRIVASKRSKVFTPKLFIAVRSDEDPAAAAALKMSWSYEWRSNLAGNVRLTKRCAISRDRQ